MRRNAGIVLALLLFVSTASLAGDPYNVREFGAKGNGTAKDTTAIQAAIDAAAKQGGGTVLLPPGKYLSGTIHLKSRITLELSAGATLIASPDLSDFDKLEELPFRPVDDRETTYFRHALLAGENLQQVTIRGPGVIDGNRTKRGGPKPIALKKCEHVSIRGVTIRNSPNYAVSLLGCDDVDIDGVTILNSHSDGIDLDCSRFARISNCYVDSWDDAICLKSSQALGAPRATEHVAVTNCVLRTSCNHLKLGTESRGGFRNIAFSNCVMWRRDTGRRPVSGVAIESVDGAEIDGVTVSNMTMQEVGTPLFVRLGNRGRGMSPPRPGGLRNVAIANIVATGSSMASSITGLEGHPVQNISLSGINITVEGGGAFAGLDVPEVPEKYPDPAMFGTLPAHSLYVRHVEGLTLRDLKTRWVKPDQRPSLVLDDVRDLELSGFRSDSLDGPQPVVWLHGVAGALLTGCRLSHDTALFLRVSGPGSKAIGVLGNDLRLARKVLDVTSGASRFSVDLTGNLTPGRLPAID